MSITLAGSNLGARHKHLNDLATTLKEKFRFDKVDPNDGDVENLIKIDLANKNKNVDYILKVLVCEDLLYVSRAIRQCGWLITNDNYKHIISPEYLQRNLYPQMMSKSVAKFNKFINLNLKNSDRVEEFYKYEDDPKKAVEWLPHCSADFINANINKHLDHIDITLLKRLCEKTITVLETLNSHNNYNAMHKALPATMFLLKHDTRKYLDIVEKQPQYGFPKFNKKSTEFLMRHAYERVIKNFTDYCNHIHLPTFLSYLKKENIKEFLINIFKDKEMKTRSVRFNFEVLTTLISSMPDDDRLEFVTQILINKIHEDDNCKLPKPLRSSMHNFYEFTCQFHYIFVYRHYWYRYTPFDYAFSKIRQIVNNQITDNELCSMFNTLLTAAAGSQANLESLIDYYRKYHKNANKSVKSSFITDLLSQYNFHKFDKKLWAILESNFMDDIFNKEILSTNDVYTKTCVEAIIIYYTLQKSKPPQDAEDKFIFQSMKSYETKLNKDEKDILFSYLYKNIFGKLNSHKSSIITKEKFVEKNNLLNNTLDLLLDWEKDLVNYPAVVDAIRDLININEQNKFGVDLSNIFNKKKSWRRVLFNEAINMNPGEPVLVNVLKHSPEFLKRFEKKVDDIYFNNKIILRKYHRKVKVYWSESLCKELVQKYLEQLHNIEHNKAVSRALCILMNKEDLYNIINKYAPVEEKIDWNNHNESTLIIRENLAKLMYIARPQPSPELILQYCKGDYYSYALPSLYSIFCNLNLANSQKCIRKLLDSKASLQKHGVRFAFIKLSKEEVKNILSEVLGVNKNYPVRQIAFKLTFKLLCKEKDSQKSQAIWNIMDSFLDNVTDKENDSIYELLLNVRDVPTAVAPLYYMKSYFILKNASETVYEKYKYSFENTFISYAREIIDQLNPEFVLQIFSHFMDAEFFRMDNYTDSKLEVLSAFLLCSENEEIQMQKYNDVMVLFIKKCLMHWDTKNNNNYTVRLNFDKLLGILQSDIQHYVYSKKQILPIRLFEEINSEIVKNLDFTSDYILLTKWQITIAFVRHLGKCDITDWDKALESVMPEFSKECKTYLIEHCKEHFPYIYVLFAKALDSCLKKLFSYHAVLGSVLLKAMLKDENHIQVYLCVMKLMKHIYVNISFDKVNKDAEELFKIISEHPSDEVQIHYYHCRNVYLKSISDTILIEELKKFYSDSTKEPIL